MEKDLQVLIEKALAAGASAARVVDVNTIKNGFVDALEMPVRLPELRQNFVLPAVFSGL